MLIGGVVVGLAAVVALGAFLFLRNSAAADEAAFQEQLASARSEGIPTTWQEFKSGIKSADPSQNAAEFYRDLTTTAQDSAAIGKLEAGVLFHRSPDTIAAARDFLSEKRPDVDLVDKASARPRCWFDRDWSKGAAVLYPEYAPMKFGAKLLGLRGSLEAAQGRPEKAIQDLHKIFAVAKHSGEDGVAISTLVDIAIYAIGLNHIALWAFTHPEEASYREELGAAVRSWPKLNMQKMHREDFYMLFDLVEKSTTPKGRADLGIKPGDQPKAEDSSGLSPSKGKVMIAKGEREDWEAYGEPPKQRLGKLEDAKKSINTGIAAFPFANKIYKQFYTDTSAVDTFDETFEARRLCYVALQRGMSRRTIARSIKTSDLLSPYDGKPIEYQFDGRQIVITASGRGAPVSVKLPTDSELSD